MATIHDRAVVQDIIDNNGLDSYAEFGAALTYVRVVEYEDQGGRTVWGVVLHAEAGIGPHVLLKYDIPSEFVKNPRVLWEHPDWMVKKWAQ